MSGAAACGRLRFMLIESSRPIAAQAPGSSCCSRCTARVIAAGDSERRRLERDLHDGAQQRLVSLSLQLATLGMRLAPGSEEELLLTAAREELAASLHELRELAHGLHPAVLSERGLDAALRSLAARAPLPVDVGVDVEPRPGSAVEIAAYYLVSEALTNIAKHARATSATVRAVLIGDRLVVHVTDDGAGGADVSGGSGLRGLAERVEALGGTLRVSSSPGHGTSVRAEIPTATPEATLALLAERAGPGAAAFELAGR
jgi:signal transduction histidine kinase